jgi:hypothetical protein
MEDWKWKRLAALRGELAFEEDMNLSVTRQTTEWMCPWWVPTKSLPIYFHQPSIPSFEIWQRRKINHTHKSNVRIKMSLISMHIASPFLFGSLFWRPVYWNGRFSCVSQWAEMLPDHWKTPRMQHYRNLRSSETNGRVCPNERKNCGHSGILFTKLKV